MHVLAESCRTVRPLSAVGQTLTHVRVSDLQLVFLSMVRAMAAEQLLVLVACVILRRGSALCPTTGLVPAPYLYVMQQVPTYSVQHRQAACS